MKVELDLDDDIVALAAERGIDLEDLLNRQNPSVLMERALQYERGIHDLVSKELKRLRRHIDNYLSAPMKQKTKTGRCPDFWLDYCDAMAFRLRKLRKHWNAYKESTEESPVGHTPEK